MSYAVQLQYRVGTRVVADSEIVIAVVELSLRSSARRTSSGDLSRVSALTVVSRSSPESGLTALAEYSTVQYVQRYHVIIVLVNTEFLVETKVVKLVLSDTYTCGSLEGLQHCCALLLRETSYVVSLCSVLLPARISAYTAYAPPFGVPW
jgi:hypothetical protein